MPVRGPLLSLLLVISAAVQPAWPYGPDGHRIAGLVAAPYLCDAAASAVERLGEGESLADLGSWADRIRGLPRWAASAPWHYMNIEDGQPLGEYRSPPEGDVLWAIDYFRERLSAPDVDHGSRSEALRFLVHFVVDLHQPLHVGRASDRGGNSVEVVFDRREITLHRFWDTEAIRAAGLSVDEYVRSLERPAELSASTPSPRRLLDWAAESLSLRGEVYDLNAASRGLDEAYVRNAVEISRRRLTQAGLRLAGELNSVFCSGDASLGP